jgi:hypothetical protein
MHPLYDDLQDLCDRLRAEHAEAVAAARAQHAAAVAAIQARNTAALEDAQAAWAAAVKQQQEEWEGQCLALREDHAAQVDAVRNHNASVWTQVGGEQLRSPCCKKPCIRLSLLLGMYGRQPRSMVMLPHPALVLGWSNAQLSRLRNVVMWACY